MKAIIGCCIEDKPGSWFVQLREPHQDLFKQGVISTCFGGPTRDDAIAKAIALGGVTSVEPWSYARVTPYGVFRPSLDLLAQLRRCGSEIERLTLCLQSRRDPGVEDAMAACEAAVSRLSAAMFNERIKSNGNPA